MKLRSWLTAGLIGMLSVLGFAAPASAAGELELSPDGVTWAAGLPAPLFDPAFRWVPGDSETASFYVRNQSSDAGVLNVIMLPAQFGDLMASGDLTVSAQVDGGSFVGATSADNSHSLIVDAAVPAGAVRKINVRIDFNPLSGNTTENRQVGLAFDVNLSQAGTVVLAPTTGNGGSGSGGPKHHAHHPGLLPGTGNDVSLSMILLAALLCVGGAGLALFSQRPRNATKEKEDSHA